MRASNSPVCRGAVRSQGLNCQARCFMGRTPMSIVRDQKLGIWMTGALVVGSMIGSGIFMLPVSLAPLGANAIVGWVVSIVGALTIAFALASLGRTGAGGIHAYIERAFGPTAAFLVTWAFWWSNIAAQACAGDRHGIGPVATASSSRWRSGDRRRRRWLGRRPDPGQPPRRSDLGRTVLAHRRDQAPAAARRRGHPRHPQELQACRSSRSRTARSSCRTSLRRRRSLCSL